MPPEDQSNHTSETPEVPVQSANQPVVISNTVVTSNNDLPSKKSNLKPNWLSKYSHSPKALAIVFVALFAVIGTVTLLITHAATNPIATLEAETMTLGSGSSIISDANASGTQAIKFDSNGTATGSISLPSTADSFTVRAKGDQCRGAPAMTVKVDTVQVGSITSVSPTSWTDYNFTKSLPTGSHTVAISFTNDNNRSGCSRNLYVDKVTFMGTVTSAQPPIVTTSAAINLTATMATLNGTANPNGSTTNCHFDYGTTTTYGTSTPNDTSPGSGSNQVSVTANLTGLTPTTAYHYRLSCTNSVATSNGSDVTFTLPAANPVNTGIWQPSVNTPYMIVLPHPLDINNASDMGTGAVDYLGRTAPDPIVYDIDGFDNPASTVTSLHGKGKKAICYISAGSWENWRSDAATFPDSVKGTNLSGWAGERWLDIRQLSILGPIMNSRMDMCKSKGFDAVDFDNVDGYTQNSGFTITAAEQITYNQYLATQAHNRGLSADLKNDIAQIPNLWQNFEFAVNEQCNQYSECTNYLSYFISNNKPVFQIEYSLQQSSFCPTMNSQNFNSMLMSANLGGSRKPCR